MFQGCGLCTRASLRWENWQIVLSISQSLDWCVFSRVFVQNDTRKIHDTWQGTHTNVQARDMQAYINTCAHRCVTRHANTMRAWHTRDVCILLSGRMLARKGAHNDARVYT